MTSEYFPGISILSIERARSPCMYVSINYLLTVDNFKLIMAILLVVLVYPGINRFNTDSTGTTK